MDELEQRLRSALTDMAGEVPASRDAWGEHERRMARRGRQTRLRPILVVAAAAAVAALIMVPVLVLNNRGGGDGVTAAETPAQTSPTTSKTSPSGPSSGVLVPQSNATYQPAAGETVVIPPASVTGESVDGGGYRNLYSMVLSIKGDTLVCAGEGPIFTNSTPPSGQQQVTKRGCASVKAPRPGKVFWGKFQLPSTDSLAVWVFIAAKNTHHVVVRTNGGTYSTADKVGSGTDFDMFSTTLSPGRTITNYTAKDAAGQTLEDA